MPPQTPDSEPEPPSGEEGQSTPPEQGNILRFPDRPAGPMTEPPTDAFRQEQRRTFGFSPHNPDLEYQPPNPMLIAPRASMSMKLMGAIIVLLLAAIFAGVMFFHWMRPLPKHPGQRGPTPGLQRGLP